MTQGPALRVAAPAGGRAGALTGPSTAVTAAARTQKVAGWLQDGCAGPYHGRKWAESDIAHRFDAGKKSPEMSACPRCNADAEDHVVAGHGVMVCGACGHLGPLDAPPARAATTFPTAGQEGRVVRYTNHGFGFIHAAGSSRDLFFHISDLLDRDIGNPR